MVNEVPGDALEEEPAEQEAPAAPGKPAARKDAGNKDLTVDGLVEDGKALIVRAKKVGLNPFKRMFRSYADTVLDAADKLFEGLEGDKRKKGD